MPRVLVLLPLAAILSIGVAAGPAARPVTLSNGQLKVELGDRGLTSIADTTLGATFRFRQDDFAIAIDGTTYESAALPLPARKAESGRVTYTWTTGPHRLDVVYELEPGWRFVSKQIFVTSTAESLRMDEVTLFRATLAEPVADAFIPKSARANLGTGDYGLALRRQDGSGLLAVAQNPFLAVRRDASAFDIRYRPEMDWRASDGPFASDRGLLAPYRQTGRRLPAAMVPEWRLEPADTTPGMDEAEVATFTELVRAFLLYRPARPLNLFVGWCVNDYQIDAAAPEGRAEYKRILDRAAELGAEYVLYAPTQSDLSRRVDSADDWSWENLLWLGLGQKIRKGEWDARKDAVPASLQEMLDYARSKNLKLVAYVYPVLPFSQNPEWLVPGRSPSRKNASLGVRSLQDWLIDTLVAFQQKTGIGGYAFDHTFLTYQGTSRYAQWTGWRRVMEELRRRVPDIAIDGRQAYHLYGPWSWLAGSYPHPTFNDEQPESFVPFPGLHFSRVSADRERYTAYRYRNYEFAPSEIVPGFITHQTSRSDDTGDMPQTKTDRDVMLTRFRARDWDYLGWRYSLLSSIAIAGWNNVLNMIPARDLEEYRHFSEDDRRWFRRWIDWTNTNKEYLRRTRTIIGQPAFGKIDGTSAIIDDRGFIFLFNPNARRLTAEFTLDETIGLSGRSGRLELSGRLKPAPTGSTPWGPASPARAAARAAGPAGATTFLLKELYPQEGRLVGKPAAGVWTYGDRVSIAMDGGSALALELQPAPRGEREPLLFNLPGTVSIANGIVDVRNVRGEAGTSVELVVVLPSRADTRANVGPDFSPAITAVRVNGRDVTFAMTVRGLVVATVRFDGAAFHKLQQVGSYDPAFAGGAFTGTFTIPQRVFDQLAARARAWPIPWTAEDFRATWLAPERLLLFVQIAEPDHQMDARLKIDGRTVELRKAYSSIRVHPRAFVGFYADVSLLSADREHRIELELPRLKPGQFQGVFFENVEPEYTLLTAPGPLLTIPGAARIR